MILVACHQKELNFTKKQFRWIFGFNFWWWDRNKSIGFTFHTAQEQFIMSIILGGIGLIGNKLNWIISTHGNWKKSKSLGPFWSHIPAKQYCQFGHMDWIGKVWKSSWVPNIHSMWNPLLPKSPFLGCNNLV